MSSPSININRYSPTIITNGIKYIKINRFDEQGNDNTLSLQELTNLRIQLSDHGIVDLPIYSITEFPTYYLYRTFNNEISSSVDNNIILTEFSASAYTSSALIVPGTSLALVTSSYNIFSDSLGNFDTSSGLYNNSNTSNILLTFSSSFTLSNTSGSQTIFFLLGDNDPSTGTAITGSSFVVTGSNQTFQMNTLFTSMENSKYIAAFVNISGAPISASNIRWSISQSVPAQSSSNLTVLEPYLTKNFFYSDCNALYGNADGLEYDVDYMKILYDNGSTIPSNQAEILSNTAERAPVKPYNYALKAQTLPRYNGVKLIQQNKNIWTEGDTSFGKEPSVQNLGTYFVYFDYMDGTNYVLTNKKAAHVLYLIDKDGKVQTPSLNSPYYPNLLQSFLSGENANISFETSTGNAANIQGIKPIVRSGVYPKPVMYSQTGSNANSSSNMVFDNIYELSNVPNYITSVAFSTYTTSTEYFNIIDNQGQSVTEIINSSNTTTNIGAYADRNIEVDVTTNKAQGIISINLSYVGYSKNNASLPPFGTTPILLRILKLPSGGSSWQEIKYGYFNVPTNGAPLYNVTLSSDPQILVDGDKYRVTLLNSENANGSIIVGPGTFTLSQTPSPSNIQINPPYWTTGSLSKNILTGSAFTGSYTPASPLYQTFPTSSTYESVLPFTLQTNDEIRFEGDETQTYTITSVEGTEVSGSLYLTLNRDIADGTDLDSFLIRRYTPDPGYILLDIPSQGGGTGFIFPEHVTLDVQRNFNTIIQDLKERGLIPV